MNTESHAMSAETILVVDDDREIRSLLSEYLRRSGYMVATAANADEMFQMLSSISPSLVILDVMMPGKDGIVACREMRQTTNIPVLILTALDEPQERSLGLEIGADDYLGKPFLPRELLARVKSILRRTTLPVESGPMADASLRKRNRRWFGDWCADLDRQEVTTASGEILQLTSAEYRLLTVFIDRPQRVLTRDALLKLTHAENSDSFDRSIDVLVSRLRTKFGDSAQRAKLIRTVRGGGYMFVEPVSMQPQSDTTDVPVDGIASAARSAES